MDADGSVVIGGVLLAGLVVFLVGAVAWRLDYQRPLDEALPLIGDELTGLVEADNPIEDLRRTCETFRRFVLANPVLAQVMFSRPFVDFDPTAEDDKAGLTVSKVFVRHARAAVAAGLLEGDPTDIAHVFFSYVEGLAAAESAGRLGGSRRTVERRWRFGLDTLIRGLMPAEQPAS